MDPADTRLHVRYLYGIVLGVRPTAMAQTSAIEWTGSTWNPVVGCAKVSPGCAHCYAERMARRLSAIARAATKRGRCPGRASNYEHVLDGSGHWNGNVHLDPGAVGDPLGWRRPACRVRQLNERPVSRRSAVGVYSIRIPCDEPVPTAHISNTHKTPASGGTLRTAVELDREHLDGHQR